MECRTVISAEAWVGIAAIIVAVVSAIGGGLVAWMTRVHWMLAQIKEQLDHMTVAQAQHHKDVSELWGLVNKLRDRIARVEERLKMQASNSWLLRDLDKGLEALEEKEGSSDDNAPA